MTFIVCLKCLFLNNAGFKRAFQTITVIAKVFFKSLVCVFIKAQYLNSSQQHVGGVYFSLLKCGHN